MTNKEFVLSALRKTGKQTAQTFQENISTMTEDEIASQKFFIPDFNPNRQYLDCKPGYVCKTTTGNIVKLIQPYDSTDYAWAQPEDLPNKWEILLENKS